MTVLQNKVAVVTGATRGLGLAIARAYASQGAQVVIGSRNQTAIDQTLEALRAEGLDAAGLACDVAKLEAVQALADLARSRFGGFDIWINNAGISGPYGPTVDIAMPDFKQVLNTNILGTYHGSIVAARQFLSHHSGKLINVIGAGAKRPIANQNAYASSKAWIRNFSLALAKECEGQGVEVIVFQPGLMKTDLIQKVDVIQGYEGRLKPFTTVIRLLGVEPDIPAEKAVWLASSATDGKNGLEAHSGSRLAMLGSLFSAAWRRLTGQQEPQVTLDIKILPSARVEKTRQED